MTCIAYFDGFMAADKQTSFGCLPVRTTKLKRHGPWIVGGCGDAARVREIHEWVAGGMKPGELPDFQRDPEECVSVMLASADGLFVLQNSHALIRIEQPFMAIGSGCDFAIAAMHLGCSAEAAVAIACTYDVGCGLGIDVLELTPVKVSKKRLRAGV